MNNSTQSSAMLKTQLLRFLAVGISAVLTDLLVYFTLLTLLSHTPAKSLSFIAGTIVAFLLNKYWTFSQKNYSHSELARFVTLYTLTLVTNVTVNTLSLNFLPEFVLFAFLAATGTSTVLNFIGQKWWVFKK